VAELDAYVAEVTRRLAVAVGDDLVGVYLHGSAAMQAFVPSRSDVDVLVVTRSALASHTKHAVAEALSEAALPCPGVGLELSIVTLDVARSTSDSPAFELHVNTQGNGAVDGAGHAGDPDLLAHFAMARARGVALLGPPAQEVIAPVDRSLLLRSLADDLAWAIDRGLGGYAVLNACRAVRLARDGVLCSKPEGGTWALHERIGDPELIEAALRRQAGADEEIAVEAAATFATHARELVLQEADG
jgi:predicted nucleotidyltransferase